MRPLHSAMGRPAGMERAAPSRPAVARRRLPCMKPLEGALPATEVGKGARAVPDMGPAASCGKGDLPHAIAASPSLLVRGECGGGRGAGGCLLDGHTLDICSAAARQQIQQLTRRKWLFGLAEWPERGEGWTCATVTLVLFGDRWRRCLGGDGPGRPGRSTRFLKALLEMLEGSLTCHNSPQRLERMLLWHFIGETEMTFYENWEKNAISTFSREL